MKVAYCSLLLPEEKKLAERSKKRLSGISTHKVTSAMIKGIEANLDSPVTLFNIINTLNYPNFPELLFHDEVWSHVDGANDRHIGYINLFGIKYITQENKLYKRLGDWVEGNEGEDIIIVVHHIFYPALRAVWRIKKKYGNRVKICLITGDLPGKYGLQSQYKVNLKELLTRVLEMKIVRLAQRFDCYVFVTPYMAEALNVADKPFEVVECVHSVVLPSARSSMDGPDSNNQKIVFYAGAVREEYGIPHLLRAFSLIEDPTYELWIAGEGNADELVLEYAQGDHRIKPLGFITPDEVSERQQLSTVLVSPRTSEHEYVKYSFPSKSFDSLASGIPYVAHRLPCDPPEYEGVIQYAQNESDEALAQKIIEICEMPRSDRDRIGVDAREFLLKNKEPNTLCSKVVRMFNKVVSE